jgi:hypothetical protein
MLPFQEKDQFTYAKIFIVVEADYRAQMTSKLTPSWM